MKNSSVKPVPDGYHTLTPFLLAKDAMQLIDFLKTAFNASETTLHKTAEGKVMHAELRIGDSRLMLAEGNDNYPPKPAMIYVYAEDCDALYHKAIAAGGISLREPTDEFYGDRSCGVEDASGNQWWLATHIEDVSPEEMQRRQEQHRNAGAANS